MLSTKTWIDLKYFFIECSQDPIGIFRSLSRTTQISIVSTTTLASIVTVISLKRKYVRYQMNKIGYRQLDQISKINQILQENNFPSTAFGFQLADSQQMTLKDVQFFASNMIKYFINFRSEIVKKNGIYYYKETINTNTFDVNQFVTYIEMDINDAKIDTDIDEYIIQHAVKYVNENNLINVKWTEYAGPGWDIFYLHYKKLHKCLVFFRCNHVLVDGLFASTCLALLQFHLWGNNNNNNNIINSNELDLRNIKENMNNIYGQPQMKKPWWYIIYMASTIIPSFISVLTSAVGIRPDVICSVNAGKHKWNGNIKWALGPPIKIKQFKTISHQQGGTVNDFFLLLCSKSIRAYMTAKNDDLLNITQLNGVGIRSMRDFSNIDNEFFEFCVNGRNANKLMYIAYNMPIIEGINIGIIQNRFARIKYGLSAWWTTFFVSLLSTVPFIMEHWVKTSGSSSTFVSSNLIGSKIPLPLPRSSKGDDDNYVKWLFGMGTPASANMIFSILTYNGYIRVGVVSEIGSISDPQLLVNCFMDQYQQYLK